MSEPETVLHGYYRSSASFRVRVALNLKGITYRTAAHHLRRNEHRAAPYLALNPQGVVPTLQIDGLTLTQSLTIIEYLDETRPQPPLLPREPAARARVRALAAMIASDIHPIDNLRVLRYLRHEMGQGEEQVQRWYNHWIAEGFAALEARLAAEPETGRFCHGDAPGLADLCLVPQLVNARNYMLDLTPYPTIVRIGEAALRLPAFIDGLPEHQPDAEPRPT